MKITFDLPDDTKFVILTAIHGDSSMTVTTAHFDVDELQPYGILNVPNKSAVNGEADDD